MSHERNAPRCGHCGATYTPGLADCAYCGCACPGVTPGIHCPACGKHNAARRTECASCQVDLTRSCTVCQTRSPLDLAACHHCHHPFPRHAHGTGPAGARPGATTRQDPLATMSKLDDILKS